MYYLMVKDKIDAAHFLRGYKGKCSRLHGHCWHIQMYVSRWGLENNMVCDFGILKLLLKQQTEKLDHYCLNDRLKEKMPTAEYLAKWFFDKLEPNLAALKIQLEYIQIAETENNIAIYRRD